MVRQFLSEEELAEQVRNLDLDKFEAESESEVDDLFLNSFESTDEDNDSSEQVNNLLNVSYISW